MKLLILGLNYAPEKVGVAVYTTGMAEALALAGHDVQVIAGRPYYPAWKIMDGHDATTFSRNIENGVDVTRAPHYIPQDPTGVRRLLHHASFALSTLFPMIIRARQTRPDIIMTIAPSLVATPVAWLAAQLCGARSWLHVQDLEVDAACATGLMAKRSIVCRMAGWFERLMLASFDQVSTISPQMLKKLREKGVAPGRLSELRNWSDIEAIHPLHTTSPYHSGWAVPTPYVALYSGNIANKQGIDIIIDTAKRLAARTDLTFIICGEGPNRANLQRQAAGLPNIQFHDLQPKERLNDLMGLATVHLLPQIESAADLVLPSKLANMLASGRPVVATAACGTGLAEEVGECGISVPAGNSADMASAIEQLLDDAILYQTCAQKARQRALDHWDSKAILGRLEARLVDVAATPSSPSVFANLRRLGHASWGQIVVVAAALVGICVYTNLMPVEQFGQAMLAMGALALLDGLVLMALSQTLLAFCAPEPSLERQRQIAAGLTLQAIAALSRPALFISAMTALIVWHLGLPFWIVAGAPLLSIYLATEMIRTGILAPMLARSDLARYSFWLAIDATLVLAAIAGSLIVFPATVETYLLAFFAAKLTSTLVLHLSTMKGGYYRGIDRTIAGAMQGPALRHGLPMSAMAPLGWIGGYIDRYVLLAMAGPAASGVYVAAASLAARPYSLVSAILANLFRPKLLDRGAGRDADDQRLTAGRQWLTMAVFTGSVGAVLFLWLGPWLASWLLAPAYQADAPMIMAAIGMSQTFVIMTHALDNTMLSMRESGTLLKAQAVLVVASLVFMPASIMWFGLAGAALGRLGAEALKFCAMLVVVRRQYGLRHSGAPMAGLTLGGAER